MSVPSPNFIQFAQSVLSLREQRQSLIATNVSNADTPGYSAKDISFEKDLAAALTNGTQNPTATVGYRTDLPRGLDGNNVSLTAEKLESLSNVTAMKSEVTYLHQATTDLITALRPNPNGV